MSLTTLDFIVLAFYAVILFSVALYVSREPKGTVKTTEDYFLAGKSLPWWAIGASLIAANISAEQIIGMSGEGYRIGLAIAAYEWQAAIVLIVIAKYFLPIFLKREIYTMPQFLDQRFGRGVKTTMSIYWIALYTVVNLTVVLWLGGLAVETLTGMSVLPAMAALGAFAIAYSIFGGLKAVALTDIIQVVILIIGGLIIAWLTMSMIGGGSVFGGLERMYTELPDKFDMIFDKETNPTGYDAMPGIWTLLGGLWILHLNYWGFNQYIIQRALGAKDLPEALLNEKTDRTYPSVMGLMPAGLRGLIFAALIAAIVSSLASMVNSISTIFTMDVYKTNLAQGRDEKHYVNVGRAVSAIAMLIAVLVAKPFIGGFESGFQTVQDMFYKRANSVGAFTALIASFVVSAVLYTMTKQGMIDLTFVNRIWIIFLMCLALGIAASHMTKTPEEERLVPLSDVQFKTATSFNIWTVIIAIVLIVLYVVFW